VYEKIGLEVSEYILEQNEGRLSTNWTNRIFYSFKMDAKLKIVSKQIY
jgi:hypothetical protein